jgi:acyl carrier protein
VENQTQAVKRLIVEALMLDISPDEIEDSASLRGTLGVDSVGFLEVLTALEDEFEVVLLDANTRLETTDSVLQLATRLNAALAGRASSS